MRIPEVELATLDPSKIRDYLLNECHRIGRFKARVFEAMGYSRSKWGIQRADLLKHARGNDIHAMAATPYGSKFVVHGRLETPIGREVDLVSVWIILHDENHPRFVTAFPG